MTATTIVATGPRELRYPSSVRAGFSQAAAGHTIAVTGGAGGADTECAWGADDAGIPFEVWLPNRFYRLKYRDSIPDDLLARASAVRYIVERDDVPGEDPVDTWGRMNWWVDNFTRNVVMVVRTPRARLAVVSDGHPRALTAPGLKGGTAHCVRTAVAAGHTRCLWIHDAPVPLVEEVELTDPTLFDPAEIVDRAR